ncbi:MAG: LLM class F420-dependent oxidoreductase [Alphaproteobacteria bacterium]|nr:LLM class F420-dependent oxidoreductase [Alphaproteobacteria bacterium]
MRLGLLLGAGGAQVKVNMEAVLEAERLGFDSVWTGESWGADAVTPAAWVLAQTTRIKAGTAIMQMSARTPAMTAQTAMTLNALSGGRFVLGIGPSGPQVIEGWHGEPFGKPLARTREYIQIIRTILERKVPLEHHGEHYRIPYDGPGATGLGRPLKSILHGDPSLKIYTGSFAPAGVRVAAEIADGIFPIFMNPDRFDLYEPHLNQGFAKAGNSKSLAQFDMAPFVKVSLDDDIEKARRPIKENLALYIGGMGAREKNFYNDYAKRLGYEEAAVKIQQLFLGGKKAEAVAAVPDRLVDEIALVGPAERIKDRLQAWKAAGRQGHVGSMMIGGASIEALRLLAEEML